MSPMGMIVYAADKIDPLRGYDSKEMIESMMNDYSKGFKFVLDENRNFLLSKKNNELNSIDNRLSKRFFNVWFWGQFEVWRRISKIT